MAGHADGRPPPSLNLAVGLADGVGISLARELVALSWRPRVLLTSTNAEAARERDVRRSGADGFVPKDQLPNAPLDALLGSRT